MLLFNSSMFNPVTVPLVSIASLFSDSNDSEGGSLTEESTTVSCVVLLLEFSKSLSRSEMSLTFWSFPNSVRFISASSMYPSSSYSLTKLSISCICSISLSTSVIPTSAKPLRKSSFNRRI